MDRKKNLHKGYVHVRILWIDLTALYTFSFAAD